MTTTLTDLLRTPKLRLRQHLGSPKSLRRDIDWAVVTELADPTPFLAGGELVLTTGVRLREPAAFQRFVDAVAQAGSVGIGFGIGLSHNEVPQALLEAARDTDLVVVEVPFEVSFAEITRDIAARSESDRVAKLESRYRQRHHLVELLLGDGGLNAMLAGLGKDAGAHFAVSLNGEVLAGTLEVDDDRVTGWDALPIALGSSGQATLHASHPRNDGLVNVARSLVGLHLSQASRRIRATREQRGQVLADIFSSLLDGAPAALRLEQFGLHPDRHYRTLVAEAHSGSPRELASLRVPNSLQATLTAFVDGRLVVLFEDSAGDARIAAEALLAAARTAGMSVRIGVGNAYPATASLRWGWHEARETLAELADDDEIGMATRISLASLILSAPNAPVSQLAQEVLAPLEHSDAEHGTALIATLDAWIAHSGMAAEVAEAIGAHRNTVRYRIEQIARLTGLDPRVTNDVVQFALARTASRLLRA